VVYGPADSADLRLQIGENPIHSRWIYAAAAAFPSLREDISVEALRSAWSGRQAEASPPLRLMASPETAQVFTAWWG
jgi:hypothetical protein